MFFVFFIFFDSSHGSEFLGTFASRSSVYHPPPVQMARVISILDFNLRLKLLFSCCLSRLRDHM